MDLEARKISFVQEFLRLQNEEIISGLERFLRKTKADFIEGNLKPMTQEQLNAEIDLAMQDSQIGRLSKGSDLLNKF